mmetsp:Transcript_3896/g.6733  ORF Transcript_3896/g.6733 Transcript_3896/m.6733 type:complete len:95 (-) Transcript_3896:217-501(-)|eukprot:CAMPEP_0197726228 /NCGR_PEP_ID=MMETSP1434-20131217/14169_1 /TAXON_ID=265543 /ORGANISM="Minutocellus polymorphus, Strain CCMP3303" /LENGTH=94 /DNA_ID=CAMNT_0043312083 /DNA_START=32 /DNA_END=316 /DNA_ORIENTATION=+
MDVAQLQDEQEAVAEAMDDLLIFPSQEVLRRSLQRIEGHFANEERAMRRCGFSDEKYEEQMKYQKQIVDMAQSAFPQSQSASTKASALCSQKSG